ncbi:uncharacterized protein LOC111269234 [Varroa jacobsoni]|uniref:Phospholipase A2-like central domain-containing protein n=1 Tax=Varroa destructor TaxID=109461 RepID=A0A7M7MDG0_VARDE|nr:uncharacterized protein LOC111247392 isoform X2 [Varroa destructor]XP_022704418.1 uncharacterized protein LOC111269234 [Varroa jacobsoni]
MLTMILECVLFVLVAHCFPRGNAGSGSRQWFTERANLRPLGSYRTNVVVSGTTVAELGYTRTGELAACRLSETKDDYETQWLARRLSSSARETNLEEMLTLIQLCGKLEASHVMSNVSYFRTYPGTLWCGPGDSASSYFELGSNAVIDRCCRDHDLCPIRAAPGEISVPLTWYSKPAGSSTNLFTISHCRCDAAFKRCLHEAGAIEPVAARALVFLYEVVTRQCLGDNGQLVAQQVNFWNLF